MSHSENKKKRNQNSDGQVATEDNYIKCFSLTLIWL